MIGTIRRHTKWLWGIIIFAVSFSLVVYFLPGQKSGASMFGPSSSGPDLGSINGEPITPQQLEGAVRIADVEYNLSTGTWLNESQAHNAQNKMRAYQMLLIESIAKQYNVVPTDDAVAHFVKQQVFGIPAEQPLPNDRLQTLQNRLHAGGMTLDDFYRFIKDQVTKEYLASFFGLSGMLVTTNEAEYFCRRENTPMNIEMVSFPDANYYQAATPTDAQLKDFFEKQLANYRLPDRIQINYIPFYASNYMAEALKSLDTNINDRVNEYYHQRGADSFRDDSGHVMTADEATAKIKKDFVETTALKAAAKDAYGFLQQLAQGHDEAHPFAVSNLFTLADTKKLVVKTTQPFSELDGSPELDLDPKYLHLLFALRENDPGDPDHSLLYVSSPLPGDGVIYVAGLQKSFPSQLRTLDEVRSQVVEDYREQKAGELSKDAGTKFAEAVQAALMQGKSFDAVCEAQKIKPTLLPPVALASTNTPSTMEKQDFQRLLSVGFSLSNGGASKFVPSSDGGFVIFLKGRDPVPESLVREEVPNYLARLRANRQLAAFQEWMGHQMQPPHFIPPPPDTKNGPG